jgi:hypothetical protein
LCLDYLHDELHLDLLSLSRPNALSFAGTRIRVIHSFYRYKKRRRRRRRRRRQEREGNEPDCGIMAAELFYGMEEIAPRDSNGLGQQTKSSD